MFVKYLSNFINKIRKNQYCLNNSNNGKCLIKLQADIFSRLRNSVCLHHMFMFYIIHFKMNLRHVP